MLYLEYNSFFKTENARNNTENLQAPIRQTPVFRRLSPPQKKEVPQIAIFPPLYYMHNIFI